MIKKIAVGFGHTSRRVRKRGADDVKQSSGYDVPTKSNSDLIVKIVEI